MKHVVDADVNKVENALDNIPAEQQYYSVDYSIKAGDGVNKRIRQVIDVNIDAPAMEGKVLGIFQDVTDLREAEKR